MGVDVWQTCWKSLQYYSTTSGFLNQPHKKRKDFERTEFMALHYFILKADGENILSGVCESR